MSFLHYLYLCVQSGVQHILMCFCLVFLRLVYPMPVSLSGLSFFSLVLRYSLTFILLCEQPCYTECYNLDNRLLSFIADLYLFSSHSIILIINLVDLDYCSFVLVIHFPL